MSTSKTSLTSILGKEWYVPLILLIPFLVSWSVWDLLPEQVPIHFNIQGEADDWGPRWINAFLMPLIGLGLYFFLLIVPTIDPKNQIENKQEALRIIRIATSLFMVVVYGVVMGQSLGYDWNITQIIFAATGLLFLLLGQAMKSVKPNYFMGIRTPWTLENEHVWNRTHAWSGTLWVWGGVAMMASSFIPNESFMLGFFLAIIAVLVLGPLIFSFLEHRKVSE